MSRFANYEATTDYLYALKSGGVKFGIDRMQRLAEALDHPERRYPVVHIAGTNGKGSVSAMIETVFRCAGYRTGLYTSPHLVKLGERVQVNRRILSETDIVGFANELQPIAEKLAADCADDRPSFFEFMTAMAFLKFAQEKVDIGVIEVGMGGRLDATNVVLPELAVITSISLDHMDQLGGTIAEIAREKAGIIKTGRPVVMGRMPPEAEAVIREVAHQHQAPIYSVREVFGDDLARYPQTSLAGDYQRWNAATATLALGLLGQRFAALSEGNITKGLLQVTWPGRWERVQVGPRTVILDSSHNPEGAEVLDANLRQLVAETGARPVVITGALGEFRARALLAVISRYAKKVYLVTPNQARACTHEDLERIAGPELSDRIARANVVNLFPSASECMAGDAHDLVVVTGSLYLLGEIMERIRPMQGSGEGRLQDF